MAINEIIITGRKFRKLLDENTKLWHRLSFWTKASDVEFDDGQTAEEKIGLINGITSDINEESENIAASIKIVNALSKSFQDGVYTLYDKCVSCGVTPLNKTPTDISNAIQSIYTNRYNSGRTQGQNDVKANPTAYGIGSGGVVANAFERSDTITARGTFGAGAHSCLYSWMVYGNYKPEFTLRNITTGEYIWNKMKPNGKDQKPSVSQYNFNLSSPAVLELSVKGAGSNAGMAFGAAALV